MTTNEKTLQELRAEVAALKEKRVEELKAEAEQRKQDLEMIKLQKDLETLKAGRLPVEQTAVTCEPIQKLQGHGTLADVKQARLRQGLCTAAHLLFPIPPLTSVFYATKTGNWLPTAAATGVAAVALPFALFDFGLTFLIAPPVTSLLMHCNAAGEKRRKLGITMPDEADAMMAKVCNF